jgi:hypothetical protein
MFVECRIRLSVVDECVVSEILTSRLFVHATRFFAAYNAQATSGAFTPLENSRTSQQGTATYLSRCQEHNSHIGTAK